MYLSRVMTVLLLSVNMSESILWNNVLTTVYTDSYFTLAMLHVSYSADVLGLGSDDTALSSLSNKCFTA